MLTEWMETDKQENANKGLNKNVQIVDENFIYIE
jgi:hypothetical protein